MWPEICLEDEASRRWIVSMHAAQWDWQRVLWDGQQARPDGTVKSIRPQNLDPLFRPQENERVTCNL